MSDPYPDVRAGQAAFRDAEVRETSVGQLTTQVGGDLSELFRKEIELVKVEVRQEASRAVRGAGLFGGAGLAANVALVFVSLAFMFLLDNAIPTGWAAFVVGVVYTLAAAVLAMAGRREFHAVSGPERTVETVKEDAQWLANRRK